MYPFQKRRQNNNSSFSSLADICKLQVVSSRNNSKFENTLPFERTISIVVYNFFKKLSSMLTDWILFSTRIVIFLLDFTCVPIVRVPGL